MGGPYGDCRRKKGTGTDSSSKRCQTRSRSRDPSMPELPDPVFYLEGLEVENGIGPKPAELGGSRSRLSAG